MLKSVPYLPTSRSLRAKRSKILYVQGENYERNKRAVDLLKYIMWRTHHAIFPSGVEFDVFVATVRRSHLKSNRAMSRRGPYGGKTIVNIQRFTSKRYQLISVSPTVQRDLQIKGNRDFATILPRITIRSILKMHAVAIVEVIEKAFLNGKDILAAWHIGCLAADEQNEAIADGHAPIAICHCTELERETQRHVCGVCHGLSLCNTMQWLPIIDLRACPSCFSITQSSVTFKSSRLLHTLQKLFV